MTSDVKGVGAIVHNQFTEHWREQTWRPNTNPRPRATAPPTLMRHSTARTGKIAASGNRSEQAAERIATLATGLDPGARLGTKEELRTLCGVSVGTFNETLRLLQARGVVTVRPGPGGGLFAATPSPMVRLGNSVLALDSQQTDVADAVRVRDALDPLLVQDALWHGSPPTSRSSENIWPPWRRRSTPMTRSPSSTRTGGCTHGSRRSVPIPCFARSTRACSTSSKIAHAVGTAVGRAAAGRVHPGALRAACRAHRRARRPRQRRGTAPGGSSQRPPNATPGEYV